ncbi:hypothetical protein [Paracraurococcus ruber]|uniref:DUF1772 domain-containing protein n=1 Tax=Paracraurococcus ruber TaxID=77675 RepID=A0ABS1D947_9PROT|nr:hypothetical protein [Paracraurococcus ruber]MBK1662404.1 hypothetical protein [Paracraurococcus ruber]TDG31312.1 hypothetical protein E2C05_11515 [Paracraurococcus ruber]
MYRTILAGFVAGFAAVLVFHQGTAFLLHHVGNDIPAVVSVLGKTNPPFNLAATKPLGVPVVLSQAFWGGVWGMALAALLATLRPPAILFSTIFGAVALTAVAVTLVPWLKGLPAWNGTIPWRGLLLNGAWGFGTALMLLWAPGLRAPARPLTA